MPTVSVIIATYNRAAYLKEAIESVRAQTYQDWELIVVDDGSTDDTRATAETFVKTDQRIRYVYQTNQGLPKTRERSIQLTNGTHVAFLDDDDLFLPQKLACQIDFLERQPQVGIVYSYVDFVDSNKRYLKTFPENQPKPIQTFLDLIDKSTIQSCGVLVRKACFDRVGGFRGDLKRSDDYEMWLRIAQAYPIAFLPERVALYRWHRANMSHDLEGRYQARMSIYQGFLRSHLSRVERNHVRSRCAMITYERAATSFAAQDYLTSAKRFLTAVIYDPVVGIKIPWRRFRNPTYLALRPYLAVCWSSLRWLFLKS